MSGKSVGCEETELLCLRCLPSLRTLSQGKEHPPGRAYGEWPKGVTALASIPGWHSGLGPQGGAVEKKLRKWKKVTVSKAGMLGDLSFSLSPSEVACVGPSHCDPEQLLVA